MVSRASKLILVNAVKHTELHNRKREEQLMWQQHSESRDEKRNSLKSSSSKRNHKSQRGPSNRAEATTSTKWMNKLAKYEESLGDERWGHGGYKELYPEEFRASSDESEVDECSKRQKMKHKGKTIKKRKASDDDDLSCSEDQERPLEKKRKTSKEKKHKKIKKAKKKKSR